MSFTKKQVHDLEIALSDRTLAKTLLDELQLTRDAHNDLCEELGLEHHKIESLREDKKKKKPRTKTIEISVIHSKPEPPANQTGQKAKPKPEKPPIAQEIAKKPQEKPSVLMRLRKWQKK